MQIYGIEFGEDVFYGMAGMPSEKIIAKLCDEQGVSVNSRQSSFAKRSGV